MDTHVILFLSVCVVFLINLIVVSEANVIYCNDQELPWTFAMWKCIKAGGTPVDKDIYESKVVPSKNNTYWTSDFTTKTVLTLGAASNVFADLCGYKEYPLNSGLSKEMFADCSLNYNYICCPGGSSSRHDCIQNGTWEKAITCNQDYSDSVFSPGIFNGKYWTRTAITFHEITVMQNLICYYQNIYQCGIINKGGTFYYTENCSRFRPSYCSFDDNEKNIPYMRVCSSPVSSTVKTPTKMKTSYMTTSSTSTKIISPEKTQRTTSQSTATRNIFEQTSMTIEQSISASKKTSTKNQNLHTKIPNSNNHLSSQTTDVIRQDRQYEAKIHDSKMVIGVAVGVGVPFLLALFLIGLIFLHRRGMICPTRTKETEAHANAAYVVTNGGVLLSSPALSTNENSYQHRDNESGRTDNVYSRVDKQNPKIKAHDSKAQNGKEKKLFRTARDTKRQAEETTAQEYDNACFKDSTKLVQRNDHDHLHEGTDEYNTMSLRNIQSPHDSEYNVLGESGVYNVADLRVNKVPNAVSTIANNGIYNILSNREEDYNTVNLHQDKAPHAALRSDDTYNTFRDNTDEYNIAGFNGETHPRVMIHHDDTYNTLEQGTEEYNTVDFHRNTEANKSEDCYDHLH